MPYFTEPPQPSYPDVPSFIRKFYSQKPNINLEYILNLIEWSEKEFLDVRSYFIVNRDVQNIRKIRNKNCLHLLAYSKGFKYIVENMTEEIWASIPNAVRKTLVETKRIYDLHSKTC